MMTVLLPSHPIRDYMGQTRFEKIKKYYHLAVPDAPTHAATGRRLWYSKVDPLLDQLRYSYQQYRMPSTHTATNECMIRATGRSQDTYKMPKKPIQQGFKFHCLADHGYIWDFHPTSNQADPDPIPPIEGLTATGAVVYHLLQKLPRSRYWIVELDKFYTSVGRLCHDLKIGGCSTARPSSALFPSELNVPKSDIGKHDYHALKVAVVKDSVFQEEVGAHL